MPAAGLEPAFVQSQQIHVGGARRAFTDLGEDIDKGDELRGELRKDRRKRVGLVPAERLVGDAADVRVVIDVDELAAQRVGKKPGHE